MEEQKVENEPPDEGEIEGTKVKSKRKNLSHDDKKGIFTMLVMHVQHRQEIKQFKSVW